jgi:hypothetical protein
MNAFSTKIFYSILLLFLCCGVVAQTKFMVTATPQKAGKDEYITLTLTVANGNNVQKINPPNITDFKVVSGPNTTTEENTINGVTSQYISLSYILLAKNTGTFNIPPATAIVNGQTFKSNAVSISVSKNPTGNSGQATAPASASMMPGFDPFNEPQAQVSFSDYILRKGENIAEKVSNNMQLKLQTSKTSCYVGEPLLASYKLYTRLRSESSLSENPSFNGFSVVEMMQPNEGAGFSTEKLNGRSYNVYTIRKVQLYPLQSGQVEVETAKLDNRISFIKYTGNNGNSYNVDPDALITETVTLNCKPVTINVKPLPEAGKPESFSGAVGNFSIDASLQKNTFSTNETGKLYITISGRGNMQLLTQPPITWPKEMEAFDARVTDNTDNKTVPISGSKTFEIPFTVGKTGLYQLPTINFSFFDPTTGTYKTVTAADLSFNVVKGNKEILKLPADTTGDNKNTISLINEIVSYRWLIILFITGIIISILIIWLSKEKKQKKKTLQGQQKSADTIKASDFYITQNPLTKTEDSLFKNECVSFYNIINEEMKNFLAKRFDLAAEEVNQKNLAIVMDRGGIANTHILQVQQLIKDIEWQLYTPFERNEALNEMYVRAQNVIHILGEKNTNTNL